MGSILALPTSAARFLSPTCSPPSEIAGLAVLHRDVENTDDPDRVQNFGFRVIWKPGKPRTIPKAMQRLTRTHKHNLFAAKTKEQQRCRFLNPAPSMSKNTLRVKLRVQVPNSHRLFEVLTCKTTISETSTLLSRFPSVPLIVRVPFSWYSVFRREPLQKRQKGTTGNQVIRSFEMFGTQRQANVLCWQIKGFLGV